MSLENYLNWTISIDCGTSRGNYQGQIKSVDQINQTITLKHTFHNGILLSEDQSDLITISAKDILNLKLLSQPGENFQIPKTILNKSNEQQLKTAPIANNGQKSIGNSSQTDRCRSSKSWSDENDFDYSSSTTNGSIMKPSNQFEEKYRCDQMILQHNNSPINYEQILLPIPTTKKYLTDEGLIIPTINQDFRHRLYHISEQYGFTLDQRIETMGHCINDMSLHLLGGTQRLSVKNRNQYPIIVVLACWNDIQGAYAIAAARILATKNIRIYLYLPLISNSLNQMNFIENQLKLFRSTDGILTHHIQDLPQSPIDLILNGLDNSDSSIRNQLWYNQLVEYSCQVRTSIIAIDPPLDVGLIPCKYSLIPLLPLSRNSNENIGRLYLCDLGFGQKVFQHLQIRYSSPFGAKSFIPLHEN